MSKPASRVKPKSEVKGSRPAVAQVQTRPQAKPQSGLMDKLFGMNRSSGKNLPAPQAPPPQPKVDPIRLAETLVTPRTPPAAAPEVTSPSQLQKGMAKPRPQRPALKAKPQAKQSQQTRLLLITLLIGVISYGVNEWRQMHKAKKESVIDEASLRAAEQSLQDRVLLHRSLTGGKLNRDRMGVEVENQLSAPELPTMVQRVRPPDVMAGLPMVAESAHRPSSRDRLQASNPDFADSRIMYTLQEQQAANDWEDKARQQYINEFVANAARAGYKVKVDSNGVVTVIGRTGAPENAGTLRLPSSPGMSR